MINTTVKLLTLIEDIQKQLVKVDNLSLTLLFGEHKKQTLGTKGHTSITLGEQPKVKLIFDTKPKLRLIDYELTIGSYDVVMGQALEIALEILLQKIERRSEPAKMNKLIEYLGKGKGFSEDEKEAFWEQVGDITQNLLKELNSTPLHTLGYYHIAQATLFAKCQGENIQSSARNLQSLVTEVSNGLVSMIVDPVLLRRGNLEYYFRYTDSEIILNNYEVLTTSTLR